MVRIRIFRSGIAAGVLGLSLVLAGCGGSKSGSSGSGASGATGGESLKGKTIALVGYGSTNPWGAAFNKEFQSKLSTSGVKIRDLTTMDAGTQVQNFNQAVAQKPDLIVLAVLDTKAMVVPIQKAKQAGIPVLAFDGKTDPAVEGDVMSVLSNNEQLGEFAAQNIIDGLKAQGRKSGKIIVLTGTKSMLVTQDRMVGFKKVLSTSPQYQIVSEQDANWDPTLSGKIAQQLLAKYGCNGVQAGYGMADYMALPIIQAAKQAGCAVGGKKGLVVTSSNCFKAGIEAIKAGELYGSATEDPITIADQTAAYVTKYLSGQNPPKHEIVQEHRITSANVDQFAAQCSHA
ncbi:MAG TPA: sugar ABC transporter substrate-binding protein [Streptosporangiaceae bacterium]|nr:sugar ABC transporter substrate-binding protein [Streptosporangiaceae bacterium]